MIPCWVLSVNLTPKRSFAAFRKLNFWLSKPCMWRKLKGMPRSLMTVVLNGLLRHFRRKANALPAKEKVLIHGAIGLRAALRVLV